MSTDRAAAEVLSLPYKTNNLYPCIFCKNLPGGKLNIAWFSHEEKRGVLVPIGKVCRACGLAKVIGFSYLSDDDLALKMVDSITGQSFAIVFFNVRQFVLDQGDDFNVAKYLKQQCTSIQTCKVFVTCAL